MLVAPEGINLFLAGESDALRGFLDALTSQPLPARERRLADGSCGTGASTYASRGEAGRDGGQQVLGVRAPEEGRPQVERLFRRGDGDLERRWAGLRAHNRWLADFCADAPGRRLAVDDVGTGGGGEFEMTGEEVGVEVRLDHLRDGEPVGGGIVQVLGDVALGVDHDGGARLGVADECDT